MGETSLVDAVQVAAQTGSNLLLVILIALLLTGRLVPRWVFDQLKEDRDAWRKQAQEQSQATKAVAPLARQSTELAEVLSQAVADVIRKKEGGP